SRAHERLDGVRIGVERDAQARAKTSQLHRARREVVEEPRLIGDAVRGAALRARRISINGVEPAHPAPECSTSVSRAGGRWVRATKRELSRSQEIMAAGLKTLQLDVTGLEFLNSAGIKALVNWLIAIKKQPPQDRYFIVLQYDEGITWQSK